MRYLPPKIEGKTPAQAAVQVRNKLIARKEAWNKWCLDPRNNEEPKGRIRDIDEWIEAINEFINAEGKKEIKRLLDLK